MASHNQHSAEIVPFPVDHVTPRYVRPIPAEQIARVMGEPTYCFLRLEEAEREREALARKHFWQAVIEWFAIAVVMFAAIYFAAQFFVRPS